MSQIPQRRSSKEVAGDYGHPWPWRERELVEEYAIEADIDCRKLADRWGISYEKLTRWVRRYGFRMENYRAVRE